MGRPTALPAPRLAACGQMVSVLSYSPGMPAFQCVTRESHRGAGERDSPPATHQTRVTQGLAGTGWSQLCAKNLQTTKNARYVEPSSIAGEGEELRWRGGQGS